MNRSILSRIFFCSSTAALFFTITTPGVADQASASPKSAVETGTDPSISDDAVSSDDMVVGDSAEDADVGADMEADEDEGE